jgi:hypothetical protein
MWNCARRSGPRKPAAPAWRYRAACPTSRRLRRVAPSPSAALTSAPCPAETGLRPSSWRWARNVNPSVKVAGARWRSWERRTRARAVPWRGGRMRAWSVGAGGMWLGWCCAPTCTVPPTTLLAAYLGVREDRLRAIVARWRQAGYAATGRLCAGPAWCWVTRAGLAVTGQAYTPARPAAVPLKAWTLCPRYEGKPHRSRPRARARAGCPWASHRAIGGRGR